MGLLKLRRRATRQPQGGVKLASNSPLLKAGALAIVTGSQPVNLASGVPLKVTGPGNKSITPAGVADAYNKDSYRTTEIFEAVGTRSFVQFWAGIPSAFTGTGPDSNAEGFLIGSTRNQTALLSNVGGVRASVRADGSGGASNEWGALYSWDGNNLRHSSGEVLTPGQFTVIAQARFQDRTELWREGRRVAVFPSTPVDIPEQGLVFGSFIENDSWRSASEMVLGGMVLGELTFDQLANFTRNEKSIWQLFDAPSRILTTASVPAADTSLSGAASLRSSAAGTLTTQVRMAGAAALQASASGALSTQVRLTGTAALAMSATGSLSTAVPLAGAAAVRATATGTLSTAVSLSGSASMTASASGALAGGGAALAGAAAVQVSATGALSTAIQLVGAASLVVSATGELAGGGAALAGAASMRVSVAGALTTSVSLVGAAVLQATTGGSLAGAGTALSGAAALQGVAGGVLSTAIPLAGAAVLQAGVGGALAGSAVLLSGAASMRSTGTGDLSTAIVLTGLMPARISAGASLSTGIAFGGIVKVRAGAAGMLTVGVNYTRAPAGSGYTPQRDERQSRPAAIQRNIR